MSADESDGAGTRTTGEADPDEAYDPLWHLAHVGLFDIEGTGGAGGCVPAGGADGAPPVTVALVDTGCDAAHPDLRGAVVEERDFSPFDRGAVYRDALPHEPTSGEAVSAALDRLGVDRTRWEDGTRERLDALLEGLGDGRDIHPPYPFPDPARRHGSHGTACAGLIAAHASAPEGAGRGARGVLPGCRIVSLAAPFGFAVRPLVHAILHAVARDVDAILLPRGLDDALPRGARSPGEVLDGTAALPDERHARATRVTGDPERLRDLLLLDALMASVSARLPFVVAAGNGSRALPEYPARLHGPDEEPARGNLIVVGAHGHDGRRTDYTSGRVSGVTVFAPGDDERRAIHALDTVHRGAYQAFGGTSAASAIVAGAVAVLQQRYKVLSGTRGRLAGSAVARLLHDGAAGTEEGVRRLDLRRATAALEAGYRDLDAIA